jgi:hypothetical protein
MIPEYYALASTVCEILIKKVEKSARMLADSISVTNKCLRIVLRPQAASSPWRPFVAVHQSMNMSAATIMIVQARWPEPFPPVQPCGSGFLDEPETTTGMVGPVMLPVG